MELSCFEVTMTNLTEVCDIQLLNETEWQAFQAEINRDHYDGVYENSVINWTMFLTYVLGLPFCFGLVMVSAFEYTGQAGPYRTLVNQLMSSSLNHMVLAYLATFLHSIRPLTGPLPLFACQMANMIILFFATNLILLSLAATVVRFCIIFVFKSIPVMDDNLLARVINLSVMIWSLLAVGGKYLTDQRIHIGTRTCSGTWSDLDFSRSEFPLLVIVGFMSFLIYLPVSLAIRFKQRNQGSEQSPVVPFNHQTSQVTNLASAWATMSLVIIVISHGADVALISKFGSPQFLNGFPNGLLVHFYAPIAPFLLVVFQAIIQYANSKPLRDSVRQLWTRNIYTVNE